MSTMKKFLEFRHIYTSRPIIKNKEKHLYDLNLCGERRVYKVYLVRVIIGIKIKRYIETRIFVRPYSILYNENVKYKDRHRLCGTWIEASRDYISILDVEDFVKVRWKKVEQDIIILLFKNQENFIYKLNQLTCQI